MVEHEYVKCMRCKQTCKDIVIHAHGKCYHSSCFSCNVAGCKHDLAQVGYFFVGDKFYCRDDYHKLLGKRCAGCSEYVEGEAVLAIESRFHPACFRCVSCRTVFPVGIEICYDGKNLFCQSCQVPSKRPEQVASSTIIGSKQNLPANTMVYAEGKKHDLYSVNGRTTSSDDDAPEVPPPPTRSKNNARHQNDLSDLCHTAPKLNSESATEDSTYSNGDVDVENDKNTRRTLSSSSMRSLSSSDGSLRQKGIGYNKLQQRMNSLKEARRAKLPTNIDPERLRQFLDDPDNNVYLQDEEFLQLFKVTREKYYSLPRIRRQELKDGILLL